MNDGKGENTHQGIIKILATANIPLVVRFIGCVSKVGLHSQISFDANTEPLIEGLTHYNSTKCGGKVGDNGHMARIRLGANITLEGIAENAIIDGRDLVLFLKDQMVF